MGRVRFCLLGVLSLIREIEFSLLGSFSSMEKEFLF